jgi:starch-binding outer membrane protein SusE/F
MKRIITAFSSLVLAAFILQSCEKEENKIFFEGGTAPVLTASTAAVDLLPPPADESAEALTLKWTNPDYMFTTGVSSQDVNYRLEFDIAGANFGSPNKYVTTIARDLERRYTVAELNAILGNSMGLQFGVKHNIEARITSTIGENAAALTSNKVTFSALPYAPPPKVPLPVGGKLFIVGNATPGGWNNPVPTPSQEFTKISDTKYEITLPLGGAGNFYLFLPENGSWSSKFAIPNNSISGAANGGEFRFYTSGGQDIPAPDAPGNYKISVDFQKGTFTVVKQ